MAKYTILTRELSSIRDESEAVVNLFTCGQAGKNVGVLKLLFEEWHLCQRINLRFSLSR